ncbi:AMP-binding protein, partial [Actinoallomurus acaciae]
VDPGYPAERIRFMLDDAAPAAVLTGAGVLAPEIADRRGVLALDDPETAAAIAALPPGALSDGERVRPADGPHPAYVIYTSGSTGRPKGVTLPGHTLAHLLARDVVAVESGPGARVLQFASPSFDVSLQEIGSAILTGGTLVVPPDEVRADAAALARWLDAEAVSVLRAPNVVLEAVVGAAAEERLPLAALRHLVQAGEALRITDELREFRVARPHLSVHNDYGPAETHVVTGHRLPDEPADWPASAPIGTALPGHRVAVLDPALRPVPYGVAGE